MGNKRKLTYNNSQLPIKIPICSKFTFCNTIKGRRKQYRCYSRQHLSSGCVDMTSLLRFWEIWVLFETELCLGTVVTESSAHLSRNDVARAHIAVSGCLHIKFFTVCQVWHNKTWHECLIASQYKILAYPFSLKYLALDQSIGFGSKLRDFYFPPKDALNLDKKGVSFWR